MITNEQRKALVQRATIDGRNQQGSPISLGAVSANMGVSYHAFGRWMRRPEADTASDNARLIDVWLCRKGLITDGCELTPRGVKLLENDR